MTSNRIHYLQKIQCKKIKCSKTENVKGQLMAAICKIDNFMEINPVAVYRKPYKYRKYIPLADNRIYLWPNTIQFQKKYFKQEVCGLQSEIRIKINKMALVNLRLHG